MKMKVAHTIPEYKNIRRQFKGTLGFVPTMGYLHEGHLELVRHAKKENKYAAVSIFVNPTQFAPNEDFSAYPRDIDRDIAMLETVNADVVFIPQADEMYPPGFNAWVDVQGITETLEGKSRPTHFRGVTTVCNKLFNIVDCQKAYFGQKDAQQARVIQKMVADLNMNLEIVVIPTIRESDGLAMSSRNTYLTADERPQATVLYRSLKLAEELHKKGERDPSKIIDAMTRLIATAPAAKIDYISISDYETLKEVKTINGKILISMAVKLGKPRLIDNIILG